MAELVTNGVGEQLRQRHGVVDDQDCRHGASFGIVTATALPWGIGVTDNDPAPSSRSRPQRPRPAGAAARSNPPASSLTVSWMCSSVVLDVEGEAGGAGVHRVRREHRRRSTEETADADADLERGLLEARHPVDHDGAVLGAAHVRLQHLGQAHVAGLVQLLELLHPDEVIELVEITDDISGADGPVLQPELHEPQVGRDVVVQPVGDLPMGRPARRPHQSGILAPLQLTEVVDRRRRRAGEPTQLTKTA